MNGPPQRWRLPLQVTALLLMLLPAIGLHDALITAAVGQIWIWMGLSATGMLLAVCVA